MSQKQLTNDKRISKPAGPSQIVLKTIDLRLAAVREATQRSRFVFIVMTIMASTILVGLWNAIFSWDRGMAFRQSGEGAVATNQELVATEWFKNLFVSVGILGIRISTNDLAVIGSISLIVIMVWFFFSQRRENRAIVGLLRDCKKQTDNGEFDKDLCELIYEGVVQSIVFIDLGGGDKPISGLTETKEKSETNYFVRKVLTFLVYLPPITIFLIVLADVFTLFIPSYLRQDTKPLISVLYENKKYLDLGKIIFFEAVAIAALVYTRRICNTCRDFSTATSETIREFQLEYCPHKQDLGKRATAKPSLVTRLVARFK